MKNIILLLLVCVNFGNVFSILVGNSKLISTKFRMYTNYYSFFLMNPRIKRLWNKTRQY
jgi:hypothetical protein